MSRAYRNRKKQRRKANSNSYTSEIRRKIKKGILPRSFLVTQDNAEPQVSAQLRKNPNRTRKNRRNLPSMIRVEEYPRLERDKYGLLTWNSKSTLLELTKDAYEENSQ